MVKQTVRMIDIIAYTGAVIGIGGIAGAIERGTSPLAAVVCLGVGCICMGWSCREEEESVESVKETKYKISVEGSEELAETNQIDLFVDRIDMCITEECKKLKNAANPKDELKKYIRQIRWKNPELAVYLQRRMSKVLNLDN